MPNTPAGMRQCPTRADGAHALFAHVIDEATCQVRQRGHYHKCPTCTHYNARDGHPIHGAAANGFAGSGKARAAPPSADAPVATRASSLS